MLVDAFKNIKITLQIKAIFKVLNNPPSSLLTSPKAAALGLVNKLLGGLFNTLKIAFICSVIFMFLNASTNISGLLIPSQKKESSLLYQPVAAIGPLLLPNIIEEVDKLQKNTQDSEPSEEETSSE